MFQVHDIIPDVHGQVEKLRAALKNLGYERRGGSWRSPSANRRCVFLGDFIDRGLHNAEVLQIVRSMRDDGVALAVMGNHELNAIHFHTPNPATGAPLRAHSTKNVRQHGSFLKEFPVGAARTQEIIDWMKGLALFAEVADFRAVHACWDEARIEGLKAATTGGVLGHELLVRAADKGDPLHDLVETTTKGPETALPQGYAFADKDGHVRDRVRLRWWEATASTWQEVAISVPDPEELPGGLLPEDLRSRAYGQDAPPVFFGHYWMTGTVKMQAHNALCLDYSAGKGGPLVSYVHQTGEALALEHVRVHG